MQLTGSTALAVENTALRARNAELEAALREIAANTYGTELTNSDAENNEILGRHLSRFQQIARKALSEKI